MKDKLFICVAAALALSSPALAQSAGGPAGSVAGAAPGTPGVAGGVQAYRPAGVPAPASGTSSSSIADSINATLEAGRIPTSGSDSATVGSASTGTGLRMQNPSTGIYNGAARPTYGGPGSTPYTGPAGSPSGSAGTYAPGAVPYTRPAGSAPGP